MSQKVNVDKSVEITFVPRNV